MKIFSGRINRVTYLVLAIIFTVIYELLDKTEMNTELSFIVYFALCIFAVSYTNRRFHDMGKSGWWTLTLFIPLFDIYTSLLLLLGAGNFGDNKYGVSPKPGINL